MPDELIQTIMARRSIRKYTAAAVDAGDVRTLLAAAMAAPSANNSRPWHFVVVADRQRLSLYGNLIYGAPLCIAVCGDPALSQSWVQDCSAATENLLLAAVSLGLGAVWIGVYPREEMVALVRRALGVPQAIVPLSLVAVGHPAEAKQPRTQYDEARIHYEQWRSGNKER